MADLGDRLRVLRRQRQLTLKAMSDRTGLSEGFLSQVERGHSEPSIASVRKIAAALGIQVSALFDEDDGTRPAVLHKVERDGFRLDLGTSRKYLLTRRPLRNLEIFVVEVDPGEATGPEPYVHGDSEEFVLVLKGTAVVQVGGRSYPLQEGDCIDYPSSLPHTATNPGPGVAELLFTISPPSF